MVKAELPLLFLKSKDKYGFTIKTFDTEWFNEQQLECCGAIDAMMDDRPVIEYAINQVQDREMDGEAVEVLLSVWKGSNTGTWLLNLTKPCLKWKRWWRCDKIIRNGSSSSSAVPTTTSLAGLKAIPV